MHLVDAHCHLDLYPDYRSVIQEISANNVHTIAVTNIPSVFHKSVEITKGSSTVYVALGLHPELAHSRQAELRLLGDYMAETRYIGEVGLDFVTNVQENRERQVMVFEKVLSIAAEYEDKIITVHSRRAAPQVIDMIGPDFPGKVILHWFSGSQKSLEMALKNGLYFSINPAMLRSESGLKIVRSIPRDHILTETDGPFVCVSGRPARPVDVLEAVQGLAGLWGLNPEEASNIVYNNFKNITE